jgi:hypothetical protein
MMESSSMGDEAMPPAPSFSSRSSSSSLSTVLLKSSSSSSGWIYGEDARVSPAPSNVSTLESPNSRFLPLKEGWGSSTTRCTAILLDLTAPTRPFIFLAGTAEASRAGVFLAPAASSFPLCDLEAGQSHAVHVP